MGIAGFLTPGVAVPGRPKVRQLKDAHSVASELARLIRRANDEVLISCGKMNGVLYGDPALGRAIEDAVQRRVRFRVLVGPEPDRSSKAYALIAKNGEILVSPVPPPLHFAVIDRRHLRIEDDADPNALPPNTLAEEVPEAASALADFFDRLVDLLGAQPESTPPDALKTPSA